MRRGGEDVAGLRGTLALTTAGAVANALWLYFSVRDGEPLVAILSGIGLVACALPAFLCARRLRRGRR